MYDITWDRSAGGWAAFHGPKKIAVINTSDDRGLRREGRVIHEAMPRSSWTIHFTSPALHVDLVTAVLASLPAEA